MVTVKEFLNNNKGLENIFVAYVIMAEKLGFSDFNTELLPDRSIIYEIDDAWNAFSAITQAFYNTRITITGADLEELFSDFWFFERIKPKILSKNINHFDLPDSFMQYLKEQGATASSNDGAVTDLDAYRRLAGIKREE